MSAAVPFSAFIVTALLEGWSVIVVEIVGARALAPYFGSSLQVWTAQITATLLFLALGYGLGGRLSRHARPLTLPSLFWIAGAWLLIYPWVRTPLLETSSAALGIAVGSFASSVALFGVPLLCLGSVSPLLISYIDRQRPGAGSAAGALFFTNTLGGLAGGWTTAFAIIPHVAVSTALMATGVLLGLLGSAWALHAVRARAAAAAVTAVAALAFLGGLPESQAFTARDGSALDRLYSRQSDVGLLQVIQFRDLGLRLFVIDGVSQGGIELKSGRSFLAFSEYIDFIGHRYHPKAKRALVLGLGAGTLASALHERGLDVLAVDLDPRVETVARKYFNLPDDVRVVISDARAFLRQDTGKYDVIFLDAFAGESAPWYLTTVEALTSIKNHLTPGGRLLINSVTGRTGESPGLSRLEASVLAVFPEAIVYTELATDSGDTSLPTIVMVAGENLQPSDEPFPRPFIAAVGMWVEDLSKRHRPARASTVPGHDDWNDLDVLEAPIRGRWREIVLEEFGPEILSN